MILTVLIGYYFYNKHKQEKYNQSTDDKWIQKYEKAYNLDSNNQNTLHDYLVSLMVINQFDKAYQISNKYFSTLSAFTEEELKNSPHSTLDLQNTSLDLWIDRSVIAGETHHCTESLGSAWIIFVNTKKGDSRHELAVQLLNSASEDGLRGTCIDLDIFIKNTNNAVMKNIIKLSIDEGEI